MGSIYDCSECFDRGDSYNGVTWQCCVVGCWDGEFATIRYNVTVDAVVDVW